MFTPSGSILTYLLQLFLHIRLGDRECETLAHHEGDHHIEGKEDEAYEKCESIVRLHMEDASQESYEEWRHHYGQIIGRQYK